MNRKEKFLVWCEKRLILLALPRELPWELRRNRRRHKARKGVFEWKTQSIDLALALSGQ